MTLQPGTKLGPYEVLSPLGAGGMGEVWKARDARLDRFVAIKVLPEHLAANPDALGRFEREAKAVAALNHPNITALHDIGREGPSVFAVMELLEGETLRARLAQGPLQPRRAVDLAVQMARGLAAAHEKGVVHRDLKPDNLWITKDGRLKILDFGLAKQAPKLATGSGSNSMMPTEALGAGGSHQTEAGMILGTVGYMSPEQVRGEAVDARSDLFAFGVVLYEMLSGKKPFARDTTSDTLAAILRDDPPELEASGRAIPAGLQRILQHCLEKDPSHRFQETHDLAFALENLSSASSGHEVPFSAPFAPPNRRTTRLWAGLVALLVLGAGALGWVLRGGPAPSPVVTLRPVTHSGHDTSPAASPDGQTLAFTSDRDGRPCIWLKQLKGGAERALTEGPDDFPRFSPDGSSVLFVRTTGRTGTLYRTSVMGGEPRKVAEDVVQGDWSPDGQQIAFVRLRTEKDRADGQLLTLPVGGGPERILATFPGELIGNPRWSPNGRRIALHTSAVSSGGLIRKVFVVEVKDGTFRELKPPLGSGTLSSAAWIGDDEILYMQSESVAGNGVAVSSAQALRQDVRSGALRRLFWTPSNGNTLDLLPDGRLVYDSLAGRQNLREWDLTGKAAPRWITRGSINDRQPVFSRDGEWVTFSSNRSGNLDLWAVSTKSGVVRSITDDLAEDWDPGYSPDGKTLLWSSNRGGFFEVWASAPDGTGAHQVTHDGEDAENPTQTPDGRWIVYASGNRKQAGIWKIHPDGSGARQLVSGATGLLPEVSPDGVWALYLIAKGTRSTVRAVRVEDGKDADFHIDQEIRRKSVVTVGRSRWMPDGRRILFTGQDEKGLDGVYVQDFVPGKDTTATRRKLAGFDPDWKTESLGLSPDGRRLVLSETENLFSILVADGVPGLARKGRTR